MLRFVIEALITVSFSFVLSHLAAGVGLKSLQNAMVRADVATGLAGVITRGLGLETVRVKVRAANQLIAY